LIIGNAAYAERPLRNPVRDATDLADTLRHLNFVVKVLTDADKQTIEQAVEDFTQGVARNTVGPLLFSGHGHQYHGMNHLLPTRATFGTASDVKYRAVSADWILTRMERSGMEVQILLLDACRDNPPVHNRPKGADGGLAGMQGPEGSLIGFATGPGKTAAD